MVEFALAIPIVLVLTLGIIEGGRLLFLFSDVYAASREAARYGAGIGMNTLSPGGVPVYRDCNGILSAAERIGEFAGVQVSNITVDYDSGPTSSNPFPHDKGTAVCPDKSSTPTDTLTLGDRIVVTVDVPYSPIVPLLPIPHFHIHSQNAHTVLRNVQIVGTPGTAVPGPTNTFTPTPTDTPTPTNTPTGEITPPTPTHTPIIPPTPTDTLTPIPTPTGGPCDTNQLIINVSINNNLIIATINNKFSPIAVSKITVRWDTGGNPKLKSIVLNQGLNSTTVFSDNNGVAGGTYSISPSSLMLPVNTSDLYFSFNKNVSMPSSGATVQIVIENNLCTLSK